MPADMLRYIIDHYDSLPATVLFHHAERFQWHNDNPDYDALALLQRLNVDYIRQQGYVSLRCAWVLGCPVEIRPLTDDGTPNPDEPISAKRIYKSAFEQMFPDEAVPEKVGAPCCSQFGVSKDAIRSRSRVDYVRYRQWLLDTPASDDLSGRVLEYAWHSMLLLFHELYECLLTAASHLWQGARPLPRRADVLLPPLRPLRLDVQNTWSLRGPVFAAKVLDAARGMAERRLGEGGPRLVGAIVTLYSGSKYWRTVVSCCTTVVYKIL